MKTDNSVTHLVNNIDLENTIADADPLDDDIVREIE